MQYIPVYGRFIGGVNIRQALKRCRGGVAGSGGGAGAWIPIFDRAKEGNTSQAEVLKSVGHILEDVAGIKAAKAIGGFYALKGSTFAFERKNVSHIYKIAREVNLAGMDLILDAETSDQTSVEDYYADTLANSDVRFYKTYQMYRIDTLSRLIDDLDAGIITRFKLVRGAYCSFERDRGMLMPSKKHVDHVYDAAVKYLLGEIMRGKDIHVMIATHNKASIEKALSVLGGVGGVEGQRVYFAKLLGMGDDVKGVKTMCRYVPYGPLMESLPYLGRRLIENYSILKSS